MSHKKELRSARNKKLGKRAMKIAHTRSRKLKNALKSCGKVFADNLSAYYRAHPKV